MTRSSLVLLIVLATACTTNGTGTSHAAAPSHSPPVSTNPVMSYDPGPASASGTIKQIGAGRVVVSTAVGELEVVLARVQSIWKETEVAASDLELGDQVDLNGTRSGPIFEARHIWANIGRFDGTVSAFDGATLDLVGHAPRADPFRIELSTYVEVVRGNGTPATVTDIRSGMAIGGVLYRPRSGPPRATKLWLP